MTVSICPIYSNENEMATPWEQAEEFVVSHWMKFKDQTRDAKATRPQNCLDSIAQGWVGNDLLDSIEFPARGFMYLPSGNGLYEWAGNVGNNDPGRGILGYAKVVALKSSGGMLFLGAWRNKQLDIPVVVVIRRKGLFILDKPNGQYRLLTEELWEEYAFAHING